jgi:phenylpropionate dioxygenase-like ring-hydroxylating dioxygenase large terminal subunit
VRAPGDFRTRIVCDRPVIFCRDSKSRIRVFLNTCRHRGSLVCREAEGNAKSHTCFYHGWTTTATASLDAVPGEDAYPPRFKKADFALKEPPRVASYRGFVFLNFDANAIPLEDYLAGAREYIDIIVDQSPSGEMEVIQGLQDYDIRANWKLLAENSFDDYHLISVHASWLSYLRNSGVEMKRPEKGHLLPGHGVGKPLGNGHGCTDNVNFRGRPVARWIPIYGEAAKPRSSASAPSWSSARRASRVARCRHEPQPLHLSEPVPERRLVGHHPHVLPSGARPHAGARLGARAPGGIGNGARRPSGQFSHVLRPGRLRHAGRHRGAGDDTGRARHLP